jgi:hypothetical protein
VLPAISKVPAIAFPIVLGALLEMIVQVFV